MMLLWTRCTNICQVPAFSSLGHGPRGGISGSYSNSVFILLRNIHCVSHSECAILLSTEIAEGIQFLHILINACYFLLETSNFKYEEERKLYWIDEIWVKTLRKWRYVPYSSLGIGKWYQQRRERGTEMKSYVN